MSSAAQTAARLVSVDWGTTSLRCFLVAGDGAVLEEVRAERGILKTDGQPFADILHELIGPWLGRLAGTEKVPVLMSGMIGSQQGWQEAAYLRCPASPNDLGQNLSRVETSGTSLANCDVRIVPGMDLAGDEEEGELADVMRGEETQVLGALLSSEADGGVFVLPGTHSKWVFVEDGSIVEFRTFMTGEVYAALLSSTILGRLADGDAHDDNGFALGVNTAIASESWASPGNLLNMLFSARSRVLHGELSQDAVRSYLSGLLIGAETEAGTSAAWFALENAEREEIVLQIIGEAELRARYAKAAALCGLKTQTVTENPVPVAHFEIAKLASLVA